MLFYLFVLILLMIFSINQNNKISVHICLFFLMALISLKGDIGPDFSGYLYRYDNFVPSISLLKSKGEIGWFFIEYITYIQKWDYQTYTIFTGVIGIGFLILAQRKIQYLGFLAFIFQILIVQLGLSGMRQFIAVCIVIYATSIYIFENKRSIIKFILLIIFAASFHISALTMLFILPFLIKLNKKQMFFIFLLIIVGLSSEILAANIDKYDSRYLQSTKYSSGAYFRFIITAIIIKLGLIKSNKKLYYLGILLLVFGIVMGFVNTIALHRFNYYLLPISCIILIRNYQLGLINPFKMNFVYLMSIFYLIIFFIYSTHGEAFVPYKFYFE